MAQFMLALDMAVVNVALPQIRAALGFATVDLAWVVHVYALTFGGFLLLGGRAGDLFGRRRLFVGGLFAFGLASLAGGLAQEPWQLVAARAVQGVAAAAVAPAALAMLSILFPQGRARVRAFGVWSAANASGGALGVLVGGLLTEYANWRWVMLVNLPIIAVALACTALGVPADSLAAVRDRLDVVGAALATGGLGLLVLGVVNTDRHGWNSGITWGTLGVAAVLLIVFVVVEARYADAPLVRLDLLRSRWVSGADLFVMFAAAAQFAAFFFASLYMQQALHMSAAATGAAFLPFSLGVIVGTIIATRFGTRYSPRSLLIPGALLAAAGLAWFALISPDGSFVMDVLGPSWVTSIGFGLCLAPVASAATLGVPPRDAGMASGLLNSARQLGGAIGLAALSTVVAGRIGAATSPAALTGGYAFGLALAAGLLVVAALVAAVVLPRRSRSPIAPPALLSTPVAAE